MKELRIGLLAFGFVVFTAFMAVQFNDATQYLNDDPWSWIFLYGLTAILSLVMIWKKLPAIIIHLWTGFSWGSLFFRLQDDRGNFQLDRLDPSTYWNEQGTEMVQASNESGGLLILAIWVTGMIFLNKSDKK